MQKVHRSLLSQEEPQVDIKGFIKENHETEHQHEARAAAKVRGRGGRLRGKSGTHENNKARGGKMAL